MYPFRRIIDLLKEKNVDSIKVGTRETSFCFLEEMEEHFNEVFSAFSVESGNTVYAHINKNKIELFKFKVHIRQYCDYLNFNRCRCGGNILITIGDVQNLTDVTILCKKCLSKLYFTTYENALLIWNDRNPNVSRET